MMNIDLSCTIGTCSCLPEPRGCHLAGLAVDLRICSASKHNDVGSGTATPLPWLRFALCLQGLRGPYPPYTLEVVFAVSGSVK